ncbi:MAG: chromosome segregation protein SMC [Gammaproteobacteria bacterium]|nr:chromosome segregation protein SMC [Gammaproteobacteria bacterium]
MRLSKIKLAGFKSFVDPTTIHLPSNLVGIVGPNGCGKSNVIDAVRWVMGESSAKSLRGDSMADVIFNGSTSRKPVSQASIELIFDNSDGALGGAYAEYGEISIKRQVGRDGHSDYFLNGVRCRRRDITDLFLGTGLGPHSYAIIEQNMISRLIEAKPDDLRIMLEEAAGISRYKERRRETETRMRHTRENIDRLNDVREELGKQLERLQRQANSAEKYKLLKEQERQVKAQLLALRWRALHDEVEAQGRMVSEQETELEAHIAQQRAAETAIEKQREQQGEAAEVFNAVQGRFYGAGAEIARLEQSLLHARERRRQLQQDLEQLEQAWRDIEQHLEADRQQLAGLTRELEQAEPGWREAQTGAEAARQALAEAEQAVHAGQIEWDSFNQRAAQSMQTVQVEGARVQHLEQQLQQLQQRRSRLEEERRTLADANLQQQNTQLLEQRDGCEREAAQRQQSLQETLNRITVLREQSHQHSTQLDSVRSRLEERRGRLASLEALQQAALGKASTQLSAWLKDHGLGDAPRLAQGLTVEEGWEHAVECVLGAHLEAVCVADLADVMKLLDAPPEGALSLFDTSSAAAAAANKHRAPPLQDKVRAPWPLGGVLADVYAADSLAQAGTLYPQLQAHESVITRGGVWLGKGWLRVANQKDIHAGVLHREQEIKSLHETVTQDQAALEHLQEELAAQRAQLQELEQQRETSQAALSQAQHQLAEVHGQLSGHRIRLEQTTARAAQVQAELQEIEKQVAALSGELDTARARLQEATAHSETLTQERTVLQQRREAQRITLDELRLKARADGDRVHQLALRIEALRSTLASTGQNLQRMQDQLGQMAARREDLRSQLAGGVAPLEAAQAELEQQLAKRSEIETELNHARRVVEEFDHVLRQLNEQRHQKEQKVQDLRTVLEQTRLTYQEGRVRSQSLEEQIVESGFELQPVLEALSAEANEQDSHAQVEQITQKIQRLGPINLAAIDEYAELSQRKNYLDAQNADLTEALTTLENAIRKIDRETRTRFQETFDKVNTSLQATFPRLFGGGHAYLELTGEDLLDTGVTVMARPPGKRNSTIHLLSGGEKALTAVALVFSIFELNPAPFCMLDEVDASLDEANVGRFCRLLHEMSERIQFIYITHNKASMEIARHLTGVTMHEPGVSRLVAVDVDEAVQLAAV